MTQLDPPRQFTLAEVQALSRTDPHALVAATRAGQVDDVLAGRVPGEPRTCPTCGSSTTTK